jgi:hypothetical protein
MTDPPRPLVHVSETAGIAVFEPRPPPPGAPAQVTRPCVWALDAAFLPLYLAPRACPRLHLRPGDEGLTREAEALLGPGGGRIAYFEERWKPAFGQAVIRIYEFGFTPDWTLADRFAGYWVSEQRQIPKRETQQGDLLATLRDKGVEVRFVPDLRPVFEAAQAAPVVFNAIRMRNAGMGPGAFGL